MSHFIISVLPPANEMGSARLVTGVWLDLQKQYLDIRSRPQPMANGILQQDNVTSVVVWKVDYCKYKMMFLYIAPFVSFTNVIGNGWTNVHTKSFNGGSDMINMLL